jgi:hypothetical protein
MAPFYCITGDYYEMGSIITTRAVSRLRGGGEVGALGALRSDDVVKLVTDVWTRPGEFQARTGCDTGMVALLIATGLVVGTLLAFATYAAGALLTRWRSSQAAGDLLNA